MKQEQKAENKFERTEQRRESKPNIRNGKIMKRKTYLALVGAIYDHQAVPTGGAAVDDSVCFLRGVGESKELQLYFLTYFSSNLQRK